MNKPAKTVVDLIAKTNLEDLALPSNLRYGKAIFERGGIEFIEVTKQKIEAWVGGLNGSSGEGGGQRRRVQLFATPQGLKWHCAGNPKNHQIFCKHCVALTLAIAHNKTDSSKNYLLKIV